MNNNNTLDINAALLAIDQKYALDETTWRGIILAFRNCGGSIEVAKYWSQAPGYSSYDESQVDRLYRDSLKSTATIKTIYSFMYQSGISKSVKIDGNINYQPQYMVGAAITPEKQIKVKQKPFSELIENVDTELNIDKPLFKNRAAELLNYIDAVFSRRDKFYIGRNQLEDFKAQSENIFTFKELADEYTSDKLEFDAVCGEYEYALLNPITGEPAPTGKGKKSFRSNANIETYRNILIEMDDTPLEDQLKFAQLLIDNDVPVRTVTTSGNKSIHIIVRVNAIGKDEYDYLIKYFIFPRLVKAGADTACKNAARLTRIAGGSRSDTVARQRLLYFNSKPEYRSCVEICQSIASALKLSKSFINKLAVPQKQLKASDIVQESTDDYIETPSLF